MGHEEKRLENIENILNLKDKYAGWGYQVDIDFIYHGDEEAFFRDQRIALKMMIKAGYYAEKIERDLWSPATVWFIVYTDALTRFDVTTKDGAETLRYFAYEP